jgi:thymidine kinase
VRVTPTRAMAKLYFYYASMNAGKSTTLLQAAFNYRERGMAPMLWTADFDRRGGEQAIASRIGLGAEAHRFAAGTDFWGAIAAASDAGAIACVLVDEAQWLLPEQVWQLARVADEANIPVVCYGLRTDFRGALFPGSRAAGRFAKARKSKSAATTAMWRCAAGISSRRWRDSRTRPICQR